VGCTANIVVSSSDSRKLQGVALRAFQDRKNICVPTAEDGALMPTVLIVDDHPGVASAASVLLQSLGCDTRIANSGAAALTFIRENSPDLVLLDVAMPGMSGFDVLRALAADAIIPGLPVVMFSATPGAKFEAMGLGAIDFVEKGEPDDLIDFVRGHLHLNCARRVSPIAGTGRVRPSFVETPARR
jgi:CheY-like chemotaxis protein